MDLYSLMVGHRNNSWIENLQEDPEYAANIPNRKSREAPVIHYMYAFSSGCMTCGTTLCGG